LIERTARPEETEALGARLAAGLRPGDVVFVRGELGTGKTTMIRGACRELGYAGDVTSPTFTLGHRYVGDVPISHLDLYRLGDGAGEEPGLLDEYVTPDAITFVEWPGAGAELPLDEGGGVRLAAWVELRHGGGDQREAVVKNAGDA
jgi:tRNA threonylcarbamoyladenosine biosynthesis protein TsaE